MKSFNPKLFWMISTAVVLGSTPFSQAQSIDGLTQQDKVKTQVQRDRNAEDIRSKLSYRLGSIKGLETVLATSLRGRDRRISSSYFFKQLLANSSQEMLDYIKYATPEAIDPKMSVEEMRKKVAARDAEMCIAAINRQGYATGRVSDLDQVLTQIMFELVAPEKDALKANGQLPRKLKAEELAIVKWAEEQLKSLPVNSAGKSALDILGRVRDLDLQGNRVRTLMLTTQGNDGLGVENLGSGKVVALQLSMLISLRTGQDEAFVRIQQCLVDYLTEQLRLFGNRMGALETGKAKSSAELIKNTRFKRAAEAEGTGIRGPRTWKNDDEKLEFFFEGHNGFADAGQEKEFLLKRIAKISEVLPYLKERVAGAVNANALLASLSKEQLDGMIDLFLHLNRDDLPVQGQVDQLKELAMNDTTQGKQFLAAAIYYRQMERDLISLSTYLDEERIRSEGKKEDLDALKRLPKP